MNDITRLFGSDERLSILDELLYSGETLGVSRLAERLGVSKGLVSGYCAILHGSGVLEKVDRKYRIRETAFVRSVRFMLNLHRLRVGEIIRGYEKTVKGMGLFGSWADGSNSRDSDIDMWVLTDRHPGEMWAAELCGRIREMTGSNVDLILLTPRKILNITNTKIHRDIRKGMTLYGKGI